MTAQELKQYFIEFKENESKKASIESVDPETGFLTQLFGLMRAMDRSIINVLRFVDTGSGSLDEESKEGYLSSKADLVGFMKRHKTDASFGLYFALFYDHEWDADKRKMAEYADLYDGDDWRARWMVEVPKPENDECEEELTPEGYVEEVVACLAPPERYGFLNEDHMRAQAWLLADADDAVEEHRRCEIKELLSPFKCPFWASWLMDDDIQDIFHKGLVFDYMTGSMHEHYIDYLEKTGRGTGNSTLPKKTVLVSEPLKSHFIIVNGILKEYSGNETDVAIPDDVYAIGSNVFSGNKTIESVKLPDGLKTIGTSAFAKSNITSIEIPSGVSAIPDNAFDHCLRLKRVTLPDGLNSIGKRAFAESGIDTIDIPANTTVIEDEAFINCKDLKNVTLHEGLECIGGWCFSGCGIQELRLPNSLKSLGIYAFASNRWQHSKLIEIEIPKQITDLPGGVFYHCNDLKRVILHEGIKSIGKISFEGCDHLEHVVIPDDCGSILFDERAFFGCACLKDIQIPGGSYVRRLAFNGCKGFETNGMIIVDHILFEYHGDDSRLLIPEGVEKIWDYAFWNTRTKCIVFPNSLTWISPVAFAGCKGLEEIGVPEGVAVDESYMAAKVRILRL